MTSETREANEAAIRGVIKRYLNAVRTWNEAEFRSTFDPKANVAHYHVKGDAIRFSTLDEFVQSIGSLHAKYDNAEEVAKEIEVHLVDRIAAVRVRFSFVMGPNMLEGQDIFNLALCKNEWKIIHKSYYL